MCLYALARYDPFGVDVPLNFDNTHLLYAISPEVRVCKGFLQRFVFSLRTIYHVHNHDTVAQQLQQIVMFYRPVIQCLSRFFCRSVMQFCVMSVAYCVCSGSPCRGPTAASDRRPAGLRVARRSRGGRTDGDHIPPATGNL